MLKQHAFYVYYEGNKVMARRGLERPVVAETLKTPQDAYDKVQSIINPAGRAAESFAEVDSLGRKMGYHSKEFQQAISGNCKSYVEKAYAAKRK